MATLSEISIQTGLTRGHSWLWRGVGDGERHLLLASALRSEAWASLLEIRNLDLQGGKGWGDEAKPDRATRGFLEWSSLSLFYRYANQQALPLPPLAANWHNHLVRSVDSAVMNVPFQELLGPRWPSRDLWPVLGLAQHYGILTRLLDWTRNPFVSAYFAATSSLRQQERNPSASGQLAVWRSGTV
jgi:hypothetical protein